MRSLSFGRLVPLLLCVCICEALCVFLGKGKVRAERTLDAAGGGGGGSTRRVAGSSVTGRALLLHRTLLVLKWRVGRSGVGWAAEKEASVCGPFFLLLPSAAVADKRSKQGAYFVLGEANGLKKKDTILSVSSLAPCLTAYQ